MPTPTKISAIAALLLTSAALTGCAPPGPTVDESGAEDRVSVEDVTRESQEAIDAARQLFEQERAEFSATIRTDLDILDVRVTALREKFQDRMAEFDAMTSERWHSTLSDLDARKASVEDQLETFMESSSEAMSEIGVGLDEAKQSLTEAIEKAEQAYETENGSTEEDTTAPDDQP